MANIINQTMLKRIKSLDIFGQPFAFNAYKDSSTFTTVIGGLLTIIWVVLVSAVAFVIISEYMDTTKPVVSVNRIRIERPPYINLPDHQLGWVYMFFDGTKTLTIKESERYLTFNNKYVRTTKTANGENKEEVFPLKMSLCANMTLHSSKKLFEDSITSIESTLNYSSLFLDSMLCADAQIDQTSYLEGSKSKLPYMRNIATIYPCSLPDPTQCASPQELTRLSIAFIQVVKVAKYSEKKNPLSIAIDPDVSFSLDISSKTQITNALKMNYVYNDDIGIVDERLAHNFLDVDTTQTKVGSRPSLSIYCTKQQIAAGLCDPYIDFLLTFSYFKMSIQRRYKQFFGVISEVGGFNDLIIYAVWMIYFLYNIMSYKNLIRSNLMASLSDFQQKSDNSQKKVPGLGVESSNQEFAKNESLENHIKKKVFDSRLVGLPELDLLVETNSKAKIFLEMVFSRSRPLQFLIPVLILNKKIQKTKTIQNFEKKEDKVEEKLFASELKNKKTVESGEREGGKIHKNPQKNQIKDEEKEIMADEGNKLKVSKSVRKKLSDTEMTPKPVQKRLQIQNEMGKGLESTKVNVESSLLLKRKNSNSSQNSSQRRLSINSRSKKNWRRIKMGPRSRFAVQNSKNSKKEEKNNLPAITDKNLI